jgi:hypothetical protein
MTDEERRFDLFDIEDSLPQPVSAFGSAISKFMAPCRLRENGTCGRVGRRVLDSQICFFAGSPQF